VVAQVASFQASPRIFVRLLSSKRGIQRVEEQHGGILHLLRRSDHFEIDGVPGLRRSGTWHEGAAHHAPGDEGLVCGGAFLA
jgi:hypothetical protein